MCCLPVCPVCVHTPLYTSTESTSELSLNLIANCVCALL